MKNEELPRAGSAAAISASSFRPDSYPEQWIDMHADAYRERPVAVLRETLNKYSNFHRSAG